MNRLAGKVAAVTGAASGIGRACALGFAREGARIFALDRTPEGLTTLADDVRTGGGVCAAIEVDIARENSVADAFAQIGRASGEIDVLLNCAAVQLHGRDARAHELSLEVWNQTLAVNLTGVFLSCKHAIPLMGRGGSIINCGSPTGLRGSAVGYDAYSASKGGVMALTRVLAMDYARDGIRVNTLVPGATETPLIRELLDDERELATIAGRIPMGRLAAPEDYVGLAVYLASDESAHATGAEFVVDGGQTAA
jgi:NAD(P)-dependent dehydrogenase (short-subunit alcohol dehydrogenase family)